MLAGNRTAIAARLAPLAVLLALTALCSARADEPADPPGRVARVNLTLGTVSMQPAGSESWVSDVLNRPMTNGDKLWADRESRAEMHIGSAAVRLGSETGVEILNIDDRSVQLKLSAGTLQVRVRALGPEQTFEIATPTASVAVLVPGDYRIMVGEENGPMQIAVAQGQVAVTDQGHEATVGAGQLADYAGGSVEEARISALPPGDAFDQWVADRDRREDRTEATQYVSREVTGYEDLDDYGSWRTAEEYGPVWVPAVSVGWAPYRYGHWGWIAPWGWTWIDDAPWGFAPFHYGRWVYYGNRWCWAPGPRRYAPVYAPALVGWVGGPHWSVGIGVGVGGPPVGWFPLGWNEVYVPSYRVSNNYVRTVNMTNTHVTNTTINNYITNNTTIINGPNGRKTTGDGELGGRKYANFAVPGAVTATSRAAFTSAQPVATHLSKLPHEDLATAPIGTGAPAIPPTARSLGRPAAAAPRAAPGLWSRPVVARTAPPPPPPSFEAQRHAVIANGGLPVPAGRLASSPQVARPGAAQPTAAARADVIHVGPAAATRPGAPAAARPTPASPTTQGARRETGGPERADRTTTAHPGAAAPPTPAHSAPPPPPPAGRPAAEFRPPTLPHEAAPQPAPHPAPANRPPVPPHEAAPQPAQYAAPASRPPSPPHEATPQPAPRPASEYRPPAQPNEAAPQSPPRSATVYRPPTQPREVTPQPPPHQTPEYRPPATPHEVAPQASPRPAPVYRPPAPPREAPPQPAPHPAQENRPPAPHEAAPAPHEGHAPPPAPHEAHPAAPPAESAPRAQPHDKR